MSTEGSYSIARRLSPAFVLALLLLTPASIALAQDATSGTATPDAPPATAADDEAKSRNDATLPAESPEAASTETDSVPAQSSDATSVPAETSSGNQVEQTTSDSATSPEGAAPPTTPTDGAASTATGLSSHTVLIGILVIAVFVVPVLIGNWLANQLRMPDYGWKISLVLFTIAAGTLIVSVGDFKFGPDLAGGITLVYELADTSAVSSPTDEKSAPDDGEQPVSTERRKVSLNELIAALKNRVDPTSTKEITIREQGTTAVEIIIPQTGPDALEYVKRNITEMGKLEFRITADQRWQKDRPIIEQAKLLPPNQKDVLLGGRKVAEWVEYDEAEFGPVDGENGQGLIKRLAGGTPEALVLIDPWNVTGEYLASTSKGVDERQGGPAVHFAFNSQGAQRFRQLTSQNLPNAATPEIRRGLGIILDKRLISAPSINETISGQGIISGRNMGEEEVEHVVSILNAGSLPLALNKTPVSEQIISPTLGAVTIRKGEIAVAISFIAVVLFMQFYYRLAGFISILALVLNLLLLLALMVLINAAFTLPGIAGIVLTIGMAVDANVLIYERIRDELRNGAALRMAIRNGFDRATATIVDANLTTVIAAVVMYAVGRGPLRGFAITLIIGIMVSMFTAVFCSRIIFEILERRGWIKTLKMHSIIGQTNFDFMGVRNWAIGISWLLIAIGFVGVYARGGNLFNIDFTGGSSVSFVFAPDHAQPIDAVQSTLDKTDLSEKNLLVVSSGESDTRYTVNTSEQTVENVKQTIIDSFGNQLMRYSFEIGELSPFSEGQVSGTEAKVVVNEGPQFDKDDGISHDALLDNIRVALSETGHTGVVLTAINDNYRAGSSVRYKDWTVRFAGLDADATRAVLEHVQSDLNDTTLFPLASKIGGRISSNLQFQALSAIALSCVGIIIYLWFRFQQVSFGLAAVVALLHDVLFTVGMVALSAYIVSYIPALAKALQIDSFQISLDVVAALLTIIGYSVNATIIIFDRLREVRGKSPNLTPEMINASVNQTLARTLLTAFTVFLVVGILYLLGGEGIHGFAYCMVVGVFVGCYSSVYIAAPVLYWLIGTPSKAPAAA